MFAFRDPDVYRDILDHLQAGVCVLDLENRIAFWSDGAEQITGYSRLDVLGHVCSENILLHCNQESCEVCEQCPIRKAFHEARAVRAEGFVHHKSGHRTPVQTWSIPLRDKQNVCIGIIQTFDPQFYESPSDPKEHSLQHGWLDEVTGLPGRVIMQSRLRETLVSFSEVHIPFAIIVLDFPELDAFRARYGQGAARSMLQVVARTMRSTVWPTDVVGRWEEGCFLVILMGCSEEALGGVASRMLRMISAANISWWGEELSLRVVLGHASARPGDTQELLLQRARRIPEQNHASAGPTAAATAAAKKD